MITLNTEFRPDFQNVPDDIYSGCLNSESTEYEQAFRNFIISLDDHEIAESMLRSSYESKKTIIDNFKPSEEELKNRAERVRKLRELREQLDRNDLDEIRKERLIDEFLEELTAENLFDYPYEIV